MNYHYENGVHIVEGEARGLKMKVVNEVKENWKGNGTYINGGFCWWNGTRTSTYALTHFIGDICTDDKQTVDWMKEMGKIENGKYIYDNGLKPNTDQFLNKALTTFCVKDGKAEVKDLVTLDKQYDYAITGIPILLNGEDVSWKKYVKNQGWRGDELYATCHSFLGILPDGKVCLMSWQSRKVNLIYSAEAYKVFKALGFDYVLKVDGGGSQILRYKGDIKMATAEHRRIHNIITMEETLAFGKYPTDGIVTYGELEKILASR